MFRGKRSIKVVTIIDEKNYNNSHKKVLRN